MSHHTNGSNRAEEDRSHHLLSLKQIPDTLLELRKELALHTDISEFASQGNTFEDCLGRIGAKLDIALDGDYDVEDLCGLLLRALRLRRFGYPGSHIHRTLGLASAQLVERADGVSLEAHQDVSLPPEEVIVTEVDTSFPKQKEEVDESDSTEDTLLPDTETSGTS